MADLAPDRSNADDVRLSLIRWGAAIDPGVEVHRKFFAQRVKAGMHLRRDRPRDGPSIRVFGPEARLRGDFGEIFADGKAVPDRDTAPLQNRYTARRRMARDLFCCVGLPQANMNLSERNFCNLGRQPGPQAP